MPQMFITKYWINDGKYINTSRQDFLDLATHLIKNVTSRSILERVGIHGDLTDTEENIIDETIISYVEVKGWQSPDPSNLLVGLALARQFAAGLIKPEDEINVNVYIEDRHCNDVSLSNTKTQKPARLTEVLAIWQLLLRRDDLIAPYRSLRGKNFRQGESFFSEKDEKIINTNFGVFIVSQRRKYALNNRKPTAYLNLAAVLDNYAVSKIDNLDDLTSVAEVVLRNSRLDATTVIDDRGTVANGNGIPHR